MHVTTTTKRRCRTPPQRFFRTHCELLPLLLFMMSSNMSIIHNSTGSRKKDHKQILNFHRIPFWLILSHLLVATAAFHVGLSLKMTTEQCPPCHLNYSEQNRQTKSALLSTPSLLTTKEKGSNNTIELQLPPTIRKMFVGMRRAHRDEFARMFDVGVPLMPSSEGNEDVVILYGDESSLPSNESSSSSSSPAENKVPVLGPEEATKNCFTMNMILLKPGIKNHCVALMGQWPSHVVYRLMRPAGLQNASLVRPLQLVSRSRMTTNKVLDHPDQRGDGFAFYVESSLRSFKAYLLHMDETLQKLRSLGEACANPKGDKGFKNTIIVMMCSHGQSELFLNFVCSARARGLDTSQVLLFATDLQTKKLAENVGIATLFDENMFGGIPMAPSKRFGDDAFKWFMLAKVYCLHLVSQLGYNILFQDSDVIWFRHPLEYFASSQIGIFDMYFQDDGSRTFRHEPYHANGGFFYIRSNKRTAYFLSVLARHGDFILKSNEQVTINVLLHEHASLTGLRVKTMNRENTEFLGGWHFHHKPEHMQKVIHGNVTPYTFHMSWTGDKTEKLGYLEQMGYLFVSESCVGKTVSETLENHSTLQLDLNFTTACCVAKPIPRCHYSDKLSMIPCDKIAPIRGP